MMSHMDEAMTLDPPGRIAVIGAGPLGLEAALYGRFLGYDVTVLERGLVAQSLRGWEAEPLPMLPSVCLSPLAIAALKTQFGTDVLSGQHPFPLTIGQWVRDGLEKLAATDLLRGHVLEGCEVVGIGLSDSAQVDAESMFCEGADSVPSDPGDSPYVEGMSVASDDDDEFEIVGEVPPDFKLTFVRVPPGNSGQGTVPCSLDFEAVIWATGREANEKISGFSDLRNAPYFFRIGEVPPGVETSQENQLRAGLQDIVRVYADLGGRAELDLYRPKRG
jgi:hypothetical protein